MTDSMIPYSFVPGTKAKASEVNANFIALAEAITQNVQSLTENFDEDISEINSILDDELFVQQIVTTASTNLNDYKRKGIYFFSSSYTPTNIPKSNSGTLLVLGSASTNVKQIWFCNGSYPEIFTRSFANSTWGNWYSILGQLNPNNQYYLRMPNGLMIQGGYAVSPNVTYPIAFTQMPAVVATKQGYTSSDTTTDHGFYSEALTGFVFSACGYISGGINWLAIGV